VSLEPLILPAIVAAGVAAASTALSYVVYTRFFVRPPPNRALVIYGQRGDDPSARSRSGASAAEIRSPRIVVGGSVFVAPWNHSIAYLSLSPVEVDVTVRSLHSLAGAAASGWEARIGAQAKIPADPTLLATAAENLLGKGEEELRALVRQAIEGVVPAILARQARDGPDPDWERLGSEIQAAASSDLVPVGLVIQNLSVRQLLRIAPTSTASPTPAGKSAMRPAASPPESPPPRAPSGVDGRLARLERSVAVLGAQIDHVLEQGVPPARTPEPGTPLHALLAPKGEPAPGAPVPTGSGVIHDSMGTDGTARARAATLGGSSGGERAAPRSFFDTETEG
jgi:hypothetical protein